MAHNARSRPPHMRRTRGYAFSGATRLRPPSTRLTPYPPPINPASAFLEAWVETPAPTLVLRRTLVPTPMRGDPPPTGNLGYPPLRVSTTSKVFSASRLTHMDVNQLCNAYEGFLASRPTQDCLPPVSVRKFNCFLHGAGPLYLSKGATGRAKLGEMIRTLNYRTPGETDPRDPVALYGFIADWYFRRFRNASLFPYELEYPLISKNFQRVTPIHFNLDSSYWVGMERDDVEPLQDEMHKIGTVVAALQLNSSVPLLNRAKVTFSMGVRLLKPPYCDGPGSSWEFAHAVEKLCKAYLGTGESALDDRALRELGHKVGPLVTLAVEKANASGIPLFSGAIAGLLADFGESAISEANLVEGTPRHRYGNATAGLERAARDGQFFLNLNLFLTPCFQAGQSVADRANDGVWANLLSSELRARHPNYWKVDAIDGREERDFFTLALTVFTVAKGLSAY